MGSVNISLVGWEAETVFCFRCVLGRVMLDSHCVAAPLSDVMGLFLRFRLLPTLLVTLFQMGLRVYCGSGAEGAWLVPLSSPGQKSHLRQRSIFEHPLKEWVLISCSCSFCISFLAFKVVSNQQHTRAVSVKGISATEDDYLNQRELPAAQALSKYSDDKTVTNISTCICGTHPLFLQRWVLSLSWVGLPHSGQCYLRAMNNRYGIPSACPNGHQKNWCPLKVQLSFSSNSEAEKVVVPSLW